MTKTARRTNWLARLRLSAKLAIVGGVLVTAIGVTFALLLASLSTSITDSSRERDGLEYLRGLRAFAQGVQAQRSATVLVTMSVDAFKPKRDAARTLATQAADAMTAIDARIATAVAAPGTWAELRKRWDETASMTHKSAEMVVADYAPIFPQLRTLSDTVRARSKLAIDPEADTARLRDFVVDLEPLLSDEIEQARGLGTRLIARVGASGEETTRFIEIYGITGVRAAELDALERSNDATVKERVVAAKKAIADIRKRMAEIFLGQNDASLTPDKYYATAAAALDSIATMASATDQSLDALLAARVANQSRHRNVVAGSVIGLIALALALAWAVLRDLLRRLRYAAKMADKVAAGDLDIVHRDAGTDELGQVVSAFRTVAQRLTTFVSAQETMAARQAAGDIDHRIDASAFPGVYGNLARQLNELVASNMTVTFQLMDTVQRYARGEFDARMPALPGRKAEITAAAEAVRSSLAALSAQIHTLASAAGRGDFSARGDVTRYSAEFAQMVGALNQLMDVCDRGIHDANRMFQALANGDLRPRISADYEGEFAELKDNANQTMAQLSRLIGEIRDGAENIEVAATEIAQGNSDLSARTEQQASRLDEASRAVADINTMTQSSAASALSATSVAAEATAIAQKGGQSMEQCITTMSDIADSAKQVHDIIGVIDSIAFQTNILALNAAVEAARAGDQGKGFAVVASEVRNLAQRSAAAAREVKTLLDSSVERIGSGVQLVETAGVDMRAIVSGVDRVRGMIDDIARVSKTQAAGIERVNGTVSQIDDMTTQNATMVEQAAAASARLRESAGELARAVAVFQVAKPAISQSVSIRQAA